MLDSAIFQHMMVQNTCSVDYRSFQHFSSRRRCHLQQWITLPSRLPRQTKAISLVRITCGIHCIICCSWEYIFVNCGVSLLVVVFSTLYDDKWRTIRLCRERPLFSKAADSQFSPSSYVHYFNLQERELVTSTTGPLVYWSINSHQISRSRVWRPLRDINYYIFITLNLVIGIIERRIGFFSVAT